jgi:threonyl-tRNA synthetase
MPAWLAPVQVAIASITQAHVDYAQHVAKMLQSRGVRTQLDLRNDKISFKIRELSLQKIPYILVVGDQEKASGQVAARARGGQALGAMSLEVFTEQLLAELESRGQAAPLMAHGQTAGHSQKEV